VSSESAIYAALVGDAPTMAYISVSGASPDEAKVYPDVIPENVSVPAIAYQRTDTEFVQTVDGAAIKGETATFEISCVATTRTTADLLADAAQDALAGAGFYLLGRGVQQQDDQKLWATVLTVSINSTP
jgi:Protein of unknown function (DUF3168)